MVKIHKSWDRLKAKLAKIDPVGQENKRVDKIKTLVFLVDQLTYDPNIPTLDAQQLAFLLKNKTTSTSSREQESRQDKQTQQQVADKDESPRQEVLVKGQVDRLVISEQIDDEFRCYDDDDFEETEFSKNLKKIRSEQTKKPSAPSTSAVASTSTSTKTNSTQSSSIFSNNILKNNKPGSFKAVSNFFVQKDPPAEVPKQPPVDKYQDTPNWAEATKLLNNGKFHSVYLNFVHFKKDVMPSTEAKTLLKEFVIKCIQEDETTFLLDIIKFVNDLNYGEDCDFWSEIVLRLKRKINDHALVKRFKTKVNPEIVYANYTRALKNVISYFERVNITLKLQWSIFLYLHEFKDKQIQEKVIQVNQVMNGASTSRQDVKLNPININFHNIPTLKLPSKQERNGNLESLSVVPRIDQEDILNHRIVTITQDGDGRPIFQVKSKIARNHPIAFRNRL